MIAGVLTMLSRACLSFLYGCQARPVCPLHYQPRPGSWRRERDLTNNNINLFLQQIIAIL